MAKWKVPLFTGLVTSTTDMTATMTFSNDVSSPVTSTTVPGFVEITGIWATNLDTTRKTVSLWLVESGGSIGDANQKVRAYPLLPNSIVPLFMAPFEGAGYYMQNGGELHLACQTANKVKVVINAIYDDSGNGQLG